MSFKLVIFNLASFLVEGIDMFPASPKKYFNLNNKSISFICKFISNDI